MKRSKIELSLEEREKVHSEVDIFVRTRLANNDSPDMRLAPFVECKKQLTTYVCPVYAFNGGIVDAHALVELQNRFGVKYFDTPSVEVSKRNVTFSLLIPFVFFDDELPEYHRARRGVKSGVAAAKHPIPSFQRAALKLVVGLGLLAAAYGLY